VIVDSIDINENNKTFATVYLGNRINFCLPTKRIKELDIAEGKYISDETVQYILTCEVYSASKAAAVKFISTKLRTVRETRTRLEEIGFDGNTIEKVINDLLEIDYLNDYKYAVSFISDRKKLKPMSSKAITYELEYRGITNNVIETALSEIALSDDDTAYALISKKFAKYLSYDEKLITKMRTFLMSRGFNYSQVSKAISKFISENQ
jgi:regulatory protein